jgi:hypothetical protein
MLPIYRIMLAAVLSGLAVKLMDDVLDSRYDAQFDLPNTAVWLSEASLPYALALLGIGALLHPPVAVCLFFASYAVGMSTQLATTYPSGLKGWQEGLILCFLGGVLTTVTCQIWALATVLLIQIIDDFIDYRTDKIICSLNWVNQFGPVETVLLAVPCLIIALLLNPISTILVLLAGVIVEVVIRFLLTKKAGQTICH